MKATERLEIIDTALTNAGYHYNAMIDSIDTLEEALELIGILSSDIGLAQDHLEHIV